MRFNCVNNWSLSPPMKSSEICSGTSSRRHRETSSGPAPRPPPEFQRFLHFFRRAVLQVSLTRYLAAEKRKASTKVRRGLLGAVFKDAKVVLLQVGDPVRRRRSSLRTGYHQRYTSDDFAARGLRLGSLRLRSASVGRGASGGLQWAPALDPLSPARGPPRSPHHAASAPGPQSAIFVVPRAPRSVFFPDTQPTKSCVCRTLTVPASISAGGDYTMRVRVLRFYLCVASLAERPAIAALRARRGPNPRGVNVVNCLPRCATSTRPWLRA